MGKIDYSTQVAGNVSKALAKSGLSLVAVAEKTGIARTTLKRRLSHPENSPFDVNELYEIAQLTKRSVSSLVRVNYADTKGGEV